MTDFHLSGFGPVISTLSLLGVSLKVIAHNIRFQLTHLLQVRKHSQQLALENHLFQFTHPIQDVMIVEVF